MPIPTKGAALALWACLCVAGAARADEIIWNQPVTSDADKAVVYEEAPATPAAVTTPAPVHSEALPPPNACAVADSPFALGWLYHHRRPATHPIVVIVIDDMGIDRKRSAAMIGLDRQLTLSFLPYAHGVQAEVDAARKAGHEVIMHVPMQPENNRIDPGPNALRADLGADELQRRIAANLDGFSGYDGINNHMGSAFTQDSAGLQVLMAELKRRRVFFLDSRTDAKSLAEDAARAAGVPTASRDVFIDHVETRAAVDASLKKIEEQALRHGSAIAIGHPKDVTIAGLKAWLPQLAARGFTLMPLGEYMARRGDAASAAVR